MQMMTESWTDGRLDDLSKRVDDGFRQVDERFKQVDARFDRLEDRLDSRFERVDDCFATQRKEANENRDLLIHELNARFDSLHSSIVYSVIGLTGSFVAAILALIAIHP